MKKLLIFLMIAIPLVVILIVNVTVDAVGGIVIVPVDSISITYNGTEDDWVKAKYDDETHSLSEVHVSDSSKTVKLASQVSPSSASNKVTYWESTNEKVALVDSYGNVTFVGFGTAEVYAITSDGTKKTSCLFNVTDTRVHEIRISAESTTLEIGSTTTINATFTPMTAENKKYTLISSNPNVVRINRTGLIGDEGCEIEAISSGEATIIATAADGSVGYKCTASLTIKVVKSMEKVEFSTKEKSITLATKSFQLNAIISPSDASNKNVTYTTTNPLVATVETKPNSPLLAFVEFKQAGTVVITVITEDGEFTDSITLTYTGGYPVSFQIKDEKIETDVSSGSVYKQIIYSFSPENPPTQNITFRSLDKSVATVDEKGLICISGGGETFIEVLVQTTDNKYLNAYIEISATRKVDSITFEKASVVTASSTYAIKPICNPLDATDIANLHFEIIEGGNLAEIDENGVVTFFAVGQIVVKVTDQSELQTDILSSQITISYTGGYPTDATLLEENIKINSGEFIILSEPEFYPKETSEKHYTFKILSQTPVLEGHDVISSEDLFTKGQITGLSGGTAIIELTIENGTDEPILKTITVAVNQNMTGIEIEVDPETEIYENKYISAENIFDFATIISPFDATNTDLVFELSDTDTATILDNNQIYFNKAGIVTLTVYSKENKNIKSVSTFWYTGSCSINATVEEALPDELINGCDPFVITLKDFIPANASNKSFKVLFTNQTSENMFSVSYNSDHTKATVSVLKPGSATISILLASANGSNTLVTKNITVLQKVESISFPYSSHTISSTQFILQCEIHPSNATQTEIIYSFLNDEYEDLATINGNILVFKSAGTVRILATLTDIDGVTTFTDEVEITTTFGTTTPPDDDEIKTENITISSSAFTKSGNKYVTAQNDILLNIELSPADASSEGLIVSVSNINIATFDQSTGILHFNSTGTIELIIMSADGGCSRSFAIQFTNGSALSYTLNIESESNFYITQTYLVKLNSYLPINSNLSIVEISEIVLSGGTTGIETEITENGINVTFNKAGTVKLKIVLSDGSQKIISATVVSTLSEILFEKESILTASGTVTLSPILLPASATDKTLKYSSSDATIATVTSNGVITFLKPGTVTIRVASANSEEVFATCTVTSTLGYVSEFNINSNNLSFSVGEKRNLMVNSFMPTNATNRNFVYEILSSTANDGSESPVVSITNAVNGVTITGLKGGTATIRVYIIDGNGQIISRTCGVVCVQELTDISISFDRQLDSYQNYLVTSLKELNISVTLMPADATIISHSITIDNANVAKIENGKLVFLTEGVIKLTASYNSLNPKTITIRYTKSALSFEIDDSSSTIINGVRNVTISAGTSYTVNVKNVIPSDLGDKTVTLTLYLNSPNYNNDTVCSAIGNVISGENGGYASYKVSVAGYTSIQILKINVVRLATKIVTEESIVTPNSSYPLSAYVLPYDTSDTTLIYTVLYPSTGVYVDSYGIVAFTKEAVATIQVKNPASGITKTINITYDMGAKEIKFTNTIKYVFIGGTLKLLTKIAPYDVQNEPIEWSVSDSSLATISSDGILTPKKVEGTVTVTAKLKNYPETVANINITIYANVYAIQFDLKNIDDGNGGISGVRVFGMYSTIGDMNLTDGTVLTSTITNQFIMSIKTLYHNASVIPALAWATSDSSIATVTDGVLTVLKAGKVTITCTPAKQYDTNNPITASYTFTFIEGLNIDSVNNFCAWRDMNKENAGYAPLTTLDANGNHATISAEAIADLKLSQYYSTLPMVLQKDLIFSTNGQDKTIRKDIYGNGYKMDLQLQINPNNSSFYIYDAVTINNVYFRGYSFGEGVSPYLTNLLNLSSVIEVKNNLESELKIVFKNCIIDGGKRGICSKNANLTLSGCIIKNSYYGGIELSSGNKDRPRNIVTVNNCIFADSLFGCILNLADIEETKAQSLITFNGNVYMFNWQNLSEYTNFSLEGDFAPFSPYLASAINTAFEIYASKIKVVDGKKYVHFGILCPTINVKISDLIPVLNKSFSCTFINNSKIGYGLDVFSGSLSIGTYDLNNYALNNSSTAISPLEKYTDDTQRYYKEIRDLT